MDVVRKDVSWLGIVCVPTPPLMGGPSIGAQGVVMGFCLLVRVKIVVSREYAESRYLSVTSIGKPRGVIVKDEPFGHV